MAYTAGQYRDQLKALLPPGRAFPRERGTTLDATLDALAIELARIDARFDQLPVEAIPTTTTELLPDWERVAGLPDNCSGTIADTIQGRRADLVSKLTARGGQSRAYYIEVAAALGYTITILEFRPFRAGAGVAGGAITNDEWQFTWRIIAPNTTITEFRAGLSSAGEPLRRWGNQALECRMNQIKPAHTILQFAYDFEDDILLLTDGEPLLLNSGEFLILAQSA